MAGKALKIFVLLASMRAGIFPRWRSTSRTVNIARSLQPLAVNGLKLRAPARLQKTLLEADQQVIRANGVDLSYVTATVVNKQGNPCPTASNRLSFEVKGNGKYRAACNGDATSLELFHEPAMNAFNGKLVILVQSSTQKGEIELIVSGDGLKKGRMMISSVE